MNVLRIKEASGVENDLDAVLTTLAVFTGAVVSMAVVAVFAGAVAFNVVVALFAGDVAIMMVGVLLGAIVLFAFGKVVILASVEIVNGA